MMRTPERFWHTIINTREKMFDNYTVFPHRNPYRELGGAFHWPCSLLMDWYSKWTT